jgi:hypothetical protein
VGNGSVDFGDSALCGRPELSRYAMLAPSVSGIGTADAVAGEIYAGINICAVHLYRTLQKRSNARDADRAVPSKRYDDMNERLSNTTASTDATLFREEAERLSRDRSVQGLARPRARHTARLSRSTDR